jgi:molybdopterin molybdotransferase
MGSVSWHEARDLAYMSGRRLPAERVSLRECLGRVTAEDVCSITPLPAHPSSAMDGWAVSGPGPWTVVCDVHAGHQSARAITDGEAALIATGAVIPSGTTSVLRSEDGSIDPNGLLHGDVGERHHIRPAGEEAAIGDVLVPAHTVLTPVRVGLAAAGGHDDVSVIRRARVQVLVTGDELLHHGPARDGLVRDSLGPQLPAWIDHFGAQVIGAKHLADTLDAHVDAITTAGDTDVIITTGGTAHGPVDHLRAALTATGATLIVDTVDCRPGHPMLLAAWNVDGHHRWLVGLPGNPQAAIAGMHTLGAPLMRALAGQPIQPLATVSLAEDVSSHGSATRLIACTVREGVATPVAHIGSGMLRGLAVADGFAVIPGPRAVVDERVEWLPLL